MCKQIWNFDKNSKFILLYKIKEKVELELVLEFISGLANQYFMISL